MPPCPPAGITNQASIEELSPYEEEPPEEDSLANHLDSLHLGN